MEKFTPNKLVVMPASSDTAEWDEIYTSDMELHIASMHECKSRYSRNTPNRGELEFYARLMASSSEMYELLKALIEDGNVNNKLTDAAQKSITELLNRINQ